MIPETTKQVTEVAKQDGVLEGYQECATEALQWLQGLGYESGHPLVRSLAAHLTRKQAYLEKLDLERFLVNETYNMEEDEEEEEEEWNDRLQSIQNDRKTQQALVNACFRGCDLRYGQASLKQT